MNAFLRNVVTQRELEQEAELLAAQPVAVTTCAGCGARVNDNGSLTCSRCRRKDPFGLVPMREVDAPNPLELEPQVLTAQPEQRMPKSESGNGKPCSVCGKPTRRNNTKGVHRECATGEPQRPKPPRRELPDVLDLSTPTRAPPIALEQFRVVAQALGFEPDALLAEFVQSWLERIRKAVSP